MRIVPRIGLVLLALVLAACVGPPRPMLPGDSISAVQAARVALLEQRPNWQLVGRIAISDGRDGGSGRLEWRQDGDRFEVSLNAPVTRRSWRLNGNAGWARLEGLDGGPHEGPDAGELLHRHLGWEVPVAELADWVRGLAVGNGGLMHYQEAGLPAVLEQRGWRVEYRDWLELDELAMPRRVFASQGDRRVRLQVDSWSISERGRQPAAVAR